MEKQLMNCPFKKVTIKHGAEPDLFNTFANTFKWCQENTSQVFTTTFIDPTTVEINFVTHSGCSQLIGILTEYIVRHTFVKACNNVVSQSGAEINDRNKEIAYAMCANVVSNFINSASILLDWSLQRFFENNDLLNITIYEKLNLKTLRNDFETILNQPHALNYLFDSLERVIFTENTNDEAFLVSALTTKSMIETRKEFNMEGEETLCVWMDNGKIAFGSPHNRFGIKEIICKELYNNGFKPQRDMTSVKIIALAILFTCPLRVVIHSGIATKGLEEFLNQYKGVFGEVEIFTSDTEKPFFTLI